MRLTTLEGIWIFALHALIGSSRALRCHVCDDGCNGADDLGTPTTCGEGMNRCEYRFSFPSVYTRGCAQGEVSNEGGCSWDVASDPVASCHCNTDDCNNELVAPTQPTPKAISCQDCGGKDCTSLEDDGSVKNCDSRKRNACVKSYKEVGGKVVNVRRGCFGELVSGRDFCEKTLGDDGNIETKCYCTSNNCNVGGLERFGRKKVRKCPPK